ncbi:hypothetical protein fugu_003899 [Takifugu bimaculatus]|nr:hypothetical protein fugu_003899 [Takifugu bimaculatus]
MFPSSDASFRYRLHSNVLTPDKIPEFCLPPRLCKRSPLRADAMASCLQDQNRSSRIGASSNTTLEDPEMKNGDAVKPSKKPLPFSAEAYGLAGMSGSANTRRKESLFLSKCPVYVFDRGNAAAASRASREAKKPSSPHCAKSFPCSSSGKGFLRGASSCPSLIDSRGDIGKRKLDSLSLISSPSCPPSLQGSSLTLVPSVFFPLDVLRSQESLQQKHSLALQGRIKVHLVAERIISANPVSSLSTVRVHVESVKRDDDDQQTLNCAVHLCLIPGKIQQRESATSTDSVFNEDFFFTGLSGEDVLELQLRIRVLNKPAAGTFSKRKVIGVITKPLSQLLNIKTNTGVTQFGSV